MRATFFFLVIGGAAAANFSTGGASASSSDVGAAPVPAAVAPAPSVSNAQLDFPDPFVLREGASYYAFATNAGGKNVPVATSNDLAAWSELPDALPSLPIWAQPNASLTWAPSVLRRGNAFVLYYTARSKAAGYQCIGRAVATHAAGPYLDDTSEPFLCQVTAPTALCGSIDPSPFVAPTGEAYLLWKSDENATECAGDARLWAQRLAVDGLSLLDTPSELLKRDQRWESPLVEGPSMVAFANRYYLFYSASWWESDNYGIGYATCDSPLGPCSKKTVDGPLVRSGGDRLGPGGQELFTDGQGNMWMAHHAWSKPAVGYSNGGRRSLRLDRLDLSGGVPSLSGPSALPRGELLTPATGAGPSSTAKP